ncbi:hypothetical protein ACJJTC_002057 [Scirpophaga incertulas]
MNAEGVTVTERDILIKLLELYKDFPCLWDLSHKDYANRDARNQAYLIMLNVFKKNDSAATLKTLKTKLDNMRTSYKRERKKVEASKTSGLETMKCICHHYGTTNISHSWTKKPHRRQRFLTIWIRILPCQIMMR